jgi:plasmid stabilization system protein ParE
LSRGLMPDMKKDDKKDDRLSRIWSPEAERDLFEIWDYVWLAATAAVADKQLHKIDKVCFVLGAWPEYGKARTDVCGSNRDYQDDDNRVHELGQGFGVTHWVSTPLPRMEVKAERVGTRVH